jgi:hypothetical protein
VGDDAVITSTAGPSPCSSINFSSLSGILAGDPCSNGLSVLLQNVAIGYYNVENKETKRWGDRIEPAGEC